MVSSADRVRSFELETYHRVSSEVVEKAYEESGIPKGAIMELLLDQMIISK
jgi:hypothetical protein